MFDAYIGNITAGDAFTVEEYRVRQDTSSYCWVVLVTLCVNEILIDLHRHCLDSNAKENQARIRQSSESALPR
jgi:hypothetical protein